MKTKSAPLQWLDRALGALGTTGDLAGAVLVGLIMLHVAVDVTSRLFFRQSLEGTTEIVSYYYMVGVVFLPLLAAKRAREFIAADILAPLMSRRVRRRIDILADLLLAAWFLFFAWASVGRALRATRSNEFVETTTGLLTVWPSRWILPAVGLVLGLSCLLDAFRHRDGCPTEEKTRA